MSNQSPNEEYMAKNNEAGRISNASNKNSNQENNEAQSKPSSSKTISDVEKEKIILEQLVKVSNNSLNQIEQTIKENAKSQTFKLPVDSEVRNERDFVGDDVNRKNEIHILCECEPNVTGAAVPVINSFIDSENKNATESFSNATPKDSRQNASQLVSTVSRQLNSFGKNNDNKEHESLKNEGATERAFLDISPVDSYAVIKRKKLTDTQESDKSYDNKIVKANNLTKSLLHKISDDKSKKQPMKQMQCIPITDKKSTYSKSFLKKSTTCLKGATEEHDDLNTNKANKKLQETKAETEGTNTNSKLFLRRPSLIPKLTRASGNCRRDHCKEGTEIRENIGQSDSRELKYLSNKVCPKVLNIHSANQLNTADTVPSTISSKMLGLQERLKATTSMLRQKIEMDKTKDKILAQQSCGNLTVEEELLCTDISVQNKNTVEDLYKNIFNLREIASALSVNNRLKTQIQYIERLFANISEIKATADKLCEIEYNQINDDEGGSSTSDGILIPEKDKIPNTQTSIKDNKIYIKFMHSKEKKKNKRHEQSPDQEAKIQTDLVVASKVTSESLNSEICGMEKNKEDEKIKESDSMDGIFIPTCEPPKNLEEEEEPSGLDITITFPELNELYYNDPESPLSLCLSDISAEALRKLKRCPKDFTLRMDFVEGKILFQSGKGPTNNFSIGPDLKFSEHIIDIKKSDIINIKPSTECSFASQLIPVENAKEIKSFKSLKSADSELFNVVNLPFMYKNHYLATNHRSCITFRSEKIISVAILAGQYFKSMPQIPSLINIFEDKILDNSSKTALQIQEKRRKTRQNQKKRTHSTTIL